MRRLLGRIVHNWPLKLAAVGLASLLYGGLALTQNTLTYPGVVPVTVINEPANMVLLAPTTPAPVTLIRYFAPSGVPVATSTFLATIDLAGYKDKVGIVSVPINVTTADGRIKILDYVPSYATIQLDRLGSRPDVTVKVAHGPVPDGLTLGATVVDPPSVTVAGAESIVSKVDAVRADVIIQSTGIDVDEEVQLTPVDKLGNALSPLDVTPATARVKIQVFSDRQTRTLPVFPIITGTPAAGFEIASVTVDPLVVLVGGDADQLAELVRVDTEPIPMNGVSEDETVSVRLALPPGVVAVGNDTITATITLRPVTATRTFTVGLHLVGARSDLTYTVAAETVLLTIGGSPADLDRLAGATLVADLDVTGKGVGTIDVPVTVDLPAGTTLVTASPASVKVTITAPAAGASAPPASTAPSAPVATAAPSPSGG